MTTISSTWAFELGRMEAEIRAKLAASLGDATPPTLRFAAGPVPSPPAAEEERPAAPSPTAEEAARAASLTAGIEDPGFARRCVGRPRQALRETAATVLSDILLEARKTGVLQAFFFPGEA